MPQIELRTPRPSHVLDCALRMRAADKSEVLASTGKDPLQALQECLGLSEFARTLLIGGKVAAVFGVRVLDNGVAVPWALTTGTVSTYPLAFWRASKHCVRELAGRYPVMLQCVDLRYTAALRWLERLGFRRGTVHPCGPSRLPFQTVVYSEVPDAR